MDANYKDRADLPSGKSVEAVPGIFRTTLTYNEKLMLCHFLLKEGSTLPLHNHEAVQIGYVIRGKLKFIKKKGESFIAGPGTAYLFESNEYHGAEVLEEAEAIDVFTPMRPEYAE
jgi:quercetin dioxygenase-like cupin family protein